MSCARKRTTPSRFVRRGRGDDDGDGGDDDDDDCDQGMSDGREGHKKRTTGDTTSRQTVRVCEGVSGKKKIVFVLSRVFCLFGRARSSGALPPLFRVNLFCTRCHVTKLHRTFCPITENCYGPLTVDISVLS